MSQPDHPDPRPTRWPLLPGATPEPERPPPAADRSRPQPAAPAGDEAGSRARRQHGPAEQDLAESIGVVWALADGPGQRQATSWLLRRAAMLASRAGFARQHPAAAVRLAWLALRHHHRLPAASQSLLAVALPPLDASAPGALDLVVEIARVGSEEIAGLLGLLDAAPQASAAGGRARQAMRELTPRLQRLLEEPHLPWAGFRLALDLLGRCPGVGPSQGLSAALRRPHLGVRARALEVLAGARALEHEEVLWLLRDLRRHPPACGPDQAAQADLERYRRALLRAVGQSPPVGGEAVLLELTRRPPAQLGADWPLLALATGYPHAALVPIDRRLRDAGSERRRTVLEAVARLPPELAGPLLLSAAGDAAPEVATAARLLFRRTFGLPCPAAAGGRRGHPRRSQAVAAVAGDPSPRATAAPASAASTAAADAGGPRRRRRQLLLLERALSSDEVACGGGGSPRGRSGWCRRVYRRFGGEGLAMLCRLDERTPWGGDNWLEAMAWMACRGLLRRDDQPALAAHAARVIAADERSPGGTDRVRDALAICARLRQLGVATEATWGLALDESAPIAADAARALRSLPGRTEVDQRAAQAMEQALGSGNWARLGAAARVGIRRGARRSCAVALRVLRADPGDWSARPAITGCAAALRQAGRLPRSWLLASLADPASLHFSAAAHLDGLSLLAEERAALERALASPARGGMAAAEAASRLLRTVQEPVAADLRYQLALSLAPAAERAALVLLLLLRGARLGLLRRHLADLLENADACTAAPAALDGLVSQLARTERAFLQDTMSRIAQPLRARAEEALSTGPTIPYWQTG